MKRVLTVCCLIGSIHAQDDIETRKEKEKKVQEYQDTCQNRFYAAYATSLALKAGVQYYNNGGTSSALTVIDGIARGPDGGAQMMYQAIKPNEPQLKKGAPEASLFNTTYVARNLHRRLQYEWHPEQTYKAEKISYEMHIPYHLARQYVAKKG